MIMKANYGPHWSKKLMLKHILVMMFSQEMFQENFIWETLLELQSENIFHPMLILLLWLEMPFQQANPLLLFLNKKFLLLVSILTTHLQLLIASQMVDLNWETHGVLLKKEQSFPLARRVSSNSVPIKLKI